MDTVPPSDERLPEAQPPRPRIDDYLTDEQQDRLARVLLGVLASAAEERAARSRSADGPVSAPEPPPEQLVVALSPARQSRARAAHARRLAAEKREGDR